MKDDPRKISVQYLPGVGPDRAALLNKLNIHTVEDLLWHLPRELLDLTDIRPPRELVEKEWQTVRGQVVDMDARQTRRGSTMVSGLLDCDGEYVRAVWFHQPWMLRRLRVGDTVLFSGKPKRNQSRWEFAHPQIQWIDESDSVPDGGLLPKYPLTEGLSMEQMRRMIRTAVETAADHIPEHLPESFREEADLLRLPDAIRLVHCPATLEQYRQARERILFDDLFEFQLGLALRRRAWRKQAQAVVIPVTTKIDARIRRLFPFRFTAGQDQVIREIVRDLSSGRAMHRLLQADVGAGKTVVAIYTMLAAIADGTQAVLMAPTELLANQHWETINAVLAHSRVQRTLLTGGLKATERTERIAQIAQGEISLIVGTQAVIQKDVSFHKLGVAVIDEQHKFGVAQRAIFSAGSESPHVLVMTATPIPRSLCLTQFGDLDLSVISELPPGRQRIVTSRIAGPGARQKVWAFLRKQLTSGRQAYVVCPRVGGQEEKTSSKGAVETYAELSAGELRGVSMGLVHGQMDRQERASVMQSFREGEIAVLVCTTVIEVGVDVPNATHMVILDAERFGLSQLHQLRGRVGRGRHQGYCYLFSESESEEAQARLLALEQTSDGFAIAEKDFELRGPGDILGVRQHGQLPLKVADLIQDAPLLERARMHAWELVDSGRFDSPEFAATKRLVLERFGKLMDLPHSG